MSTTDDIATPMEMMMEDSKNTHQNEPEKAPINVPDSPVLQGIMRLSKLMSPDNAPFPQGKEPNPLIPQHSPLESLVATHTESPQAHPHHKRNLSVTFVDNNPVTPSPRSSFHRNPDESPQRRIKSPRKPTVPLNVSLANRPTKAWLAKHGQLPGQKDAEIELNPTGKRARENHLLPSNNKRQKKWHCTVPVESVPNRPTKSWLAKVEASRAIHERLEKRHSGNATDNDTACPYFESIATLHTPNGQFFHYGDHQYP